MQAIAAALVVAVGDAKGRCQTGPLYPMISPWILAPQAFVLTSSSRDHHAGSLSQDEAVAIPIEGATGSFGLVITSLKVPARRMNPVKLNGRIMLWVPPDRITSALPRRISSYAPPIACELCAGCQAALALGPLASATILPWAGGRPRLCSDSRDQVQLFDPQPGELRGVNVAAARAP